MSNLETTATISDSRQRLLDAAQTLFHERGYRAVTMQDVARALGVRQIDRLVLSHRDGDHTGGAAAVLAAHPGARVMGAPPPAASDAAPPVTPCVDGQRWQWDGVRFEVLHPTAADADRPGLRSNALSCVLRVVAGTRAALLAGDVEAAQEARLVRDHGAAGLRADVLLVPHHGSRTSSSEVFLAATAPRLALVQAGWRNRFGHPHPEVVQRLELHGARVVETARCGAVRWSSAEPDRLGCERARNPRYWQQRAGVDDGGGAGRTDSVPTSGN